MLFDVPFNIVENIIVVEVKSVAALLSIHDAQVLTYLALAECPAGLLINFQCSKAGGWRETVGQPTDDTPVTPALRAGTWIDRCSNHKPHWSTSGL